jgi:LacI family transcriptional regulator
MADPEPVTPSLRAIAKAAGVSVSTVSCALRGEPGVAVATGAHIREVAESMGWRANPLVSAWLAHVRATTPQRKNVSLGFLISDKESSARYFDSPVYRAYHRGAAERAQRLGFELEVFHVESTGVKRLNQVLASRSIPGVIVAPLQHSGVLEQFNWQAVSCAAIAHSLIEPQIHRAANHHFHSVAMALRELAKRGYRRIGLAMTRGHDTRSGGMFSGAYWAFAQSHQGTAIPPFYPDKSQFTFSHFAQWYRDAQPDAVLGFAVVHDWLQRCGVSIPQDTAFANLDWHVSYGPQAGINQKPELIGAAAVDLVTSQIFRNERGIPTDKKLLLIESDWVDGPTAPQKGRGSQI